MRHSPYNGIAKIDDRKRVEQHDLESEYSERDAVSFGPAAKQRSRVAVRLALEIGSFHSALRSETRLENSR